MRYAFLLFSCLWAFHANAAYRIIKVAPSSGNSFHFDATPTEQSGCTVTLSRPMENVKVLRETSTHLYVQFEQPLNGCAWQSVVDGLDMRAGYISKKEVKWKVVRLEPSEAEINIKPIEVAGNKGSLPKELLDEPCKPVNGLGSFLEQEQAPVEEETAYDLNNMATDKSEAANIEGLIKLLRREQAGLKSTIGIDKYMECYPIGKRGLANYYKYAKYIDLASDVFRIEVKDNLFEVHPSLMRCLIRRESGFDPSEKSGTGAVGLGQHTEINISDINKRINKKGSWEQKLWRAYFAQVAKTKEGREMMESCKGSSKKGGNPVFANKDDARCPLNSIAASAIYNLIIQRDLMNSSKENNIEWEQELDYQLAVAAAYNLGNGAARLAVNKNVVERWINAILRISKKSKNPNKDEEVDGHISAIRNCMQENNWKPMHKEDQPQCKDYDQLIAPKKKN